MKFHNKYIIFFVVLFSSLLNIGKAQNKTVDSLRKIIGSGKPDTTKINALNILAFHLHTVQPDSTIILTKRALELLNKLSAKGEKSKIWKQHMEASIHSNMGVGYCVKGDYSNALQSYSTALKTDEALRDKRGMATRLGNIGLVYYYQGEYPKALSNYIQALRIDEEMGNKPGIGRHLGNIGLVYYRQGFPDKAITFHLRALKINEELKRKRDIAIDLANIGIAYRKRGSNDTAVMYYLKALKIDEEIGNKFGMAERYGNIGNIYEDQGNYPRALEFDMKALKMAEKLGDEQTIAINKGNIGNLYFLQGNYPKAISYSKQGLADAKRIGYKEAVQEFAHTLAKIYSKEKDFENAYNAHLQYTAVKDSLFNEENSKKIATVQGLYESEKKDKEIKLLMKDASLQSLEIRRQRIISYAIAGGLILVSILGLIVFRNFKTKQRANELLQQYNSEIISQKQEITDSINYARRIQSAILPSVDLIYKTLEQSFILYKPKDVVSGDFYAFAEKEENVILAAVDCTGHGVPGAFMSVIGHNLLTEIIVERGIVDPSAILSDLNKAVRKVLKQDENKTRDGMDIAICNINVKEKKLKYAGANRPLWMIKKGNSSIMEIKATKCSIGGHTDVEQQFESNEIKLEEGDSLYLFSDGFADQFGGPEGKKFMSKRLKELLLSVNDLSMTQQAVRIEESFETWKGPHEQVDDVCVIGVKI